MDTRTDESIVAENGSFAESSGGAPLVSAAMSPAALLMSPVASVVSPAVSVEQSALAAISAVPAAAIDPSPASVLTAAVDAAASDATAGDVGVEPVADAETTEAVALTNAEKAEAEAKPESAASRRARVALVEGIQFVSAAWVDELQASLNKEHRAVSGGWPGTLSEARHRVAACLVPWLQRQSCDADSARLSIEVARQLNAAARRAWLQRADHDWESC